MSQNNRSRKRKRNRYTLRELLKKAELFRTLAQENKDWLEMPPVGREFGSGTDMDPAIQKRASADPESDK